MLNNELFGEFNPARHTAAAVLNDYQTYKDLNGIYYLSDTTNYIFTSEDDALFTTTEEILEELQSLLSEEYTLEVTEVLRSYNDLQEEVLKSQNAEVSNRQCDNFYYHDLQIEIKKVND